jgi:uncharacterized protein
VNYAQYNPNLKHDPLTDDEIDRLEDILAEVPTEGAMDLECLDGYLTALLVSPELPPTDDWMPRVWGGDTENGPPFGSGKQHKRCTLLVMRWLAQLDQQLRKDVETLEPLFGMADDGETEWVDAELWCIGFLHGLSLTAAQWEPHLEDAEVAVALRSIALLGSDDLSVDDAALVETPAQRDEWSRQVPESIVTLYRHWRA